jgi:preprotein translocase subunit SecG
MNLMLNLVVALQIVTALVMIGLVLVQHGKGADMGASFGSGASGSLFGATGSANFLSRSTAACAAVFFACTLALAFFSNDRARPSTGSVLDRPAIGGPAASGAASSSTGAPGVLPGALPSAGTTTPAPAATASSGATVAPTGGASGAPQLLK